MVAIENYYEYISKKMKTKDMQTVVKNKHEIDDDPTKISHDLDRVVSLTTIQSWITRSDLSIYHILRSMYAQFEQKSISRRLNIA